MLNQFALNAAPTENHNILARLPINTYWTSNYDPLIEVSLKSAGKRVDIKHTTEQLAVTKTKRDAIVYKMHGDAEHSHDAVLTKDDYEKYHIKRGAFINALAGDLISKTFLFIGFSFTDPNLDYVLSRIRITFRENQRQHYCIFKKTDRQEHKTDTDFEYAKTKQNLMIEDLKRFNIKTLLINEYSQITDILSKIEARYKQRSIFVSGSAEEYGDWTKKTAIEFLSNLSRTLVQKGYRIISGFGLGVGDAIISGAINEVYQTRKGHIEDSLVIRPFPQESVDETNRQQLWEQYRQEMIPTAGICLIVFGNKKINDNISIANGVRREFEIAHKHGLLIVPIGATGYCAQEIWNELKSSLINYFPNKNPNDLEKHFALLGNATDQPSTLITHILNFITFVTKE